MEGGRKRERRGERERVRERERERERERGGMEVEEQTDIMTNRNITEEHAEGQTETQADGHTVQADHSNTILLT